MALSKDFHVWDESRQELLNTYAEGSIDRALADTIKDCVEEAEILGITREKLFGKTKGDTKTSMVRGFLMLTLWNNLKVKLGNPSYTQELSARIFGRERTTLLYFKRKAKEGVDTIYLEVRDSDFAVSVNKRLKDFLDRSWEMFTP